MCLSLESGFQRRTVFKLLTPKFTEATEKSVFGEKPPLNGKTSKFCYERFRGTLMRIPAKFRGNLVSGNGQTGRW